jgi:hypothetical protein
MDETDEPSPEEFVAEIDGQPHRFVIEEQMTQTTPVLHEEVVVDLGPVDPPEVGAPCPPTAGTS